VADVHANATASEIFAIPVCQPILNRLLDLQKLYAGSAEMYWKGAFPGLAFETHPDLGGDVDVDIPGTQLMMQQYMNGLQRYLTLVGMKVTSIAPQVSDPESQISTQLEAIAIQIRWPKRNFIGAEEGQLASSEDRTQVKETITERERNYGTPRLLAPFIDRLIKLNILPIPYAEPKPPPMPSPGMQPGLAGLAGEPGEHLGEEEEDASAAPAEADEPQPRGPESLTRNYGDPTEEGPDPEEPAPSSYRVQQPQPPGLFPQEGQQSQEYPDQEVPEDGYMIDWPERDTASDKDKSIVSVGWIKAVAQYYASGLAAFVPPMEFFTIIMKFTEAEAKNIIKMGKQFLMESNPQSGLPGSPPAPIYGMPPNPMAGASGEGMPGAGGLGGTPPGGAPPPNAGNGGAGSPPGGPFSDPTSFFGRHGEQQRGQDSKTGGSYIGNAAIRRQQALNNTAAIREVMLNDTGSMDWDTRRRLISALVPAPGAALTQLSPQEVAINQEINAADEFFTVNSPVAELEKQLKELYGDDISTSSLTENPFVSEAQRAYMHIHHPEMAKEWESKTPKGKKLPKHVKGSKAAKSKKAK
jgi:hypothetical protein